MYLTSSQNKIILPSNATAIVVDIGAHDGSEAIHFALKKSTNGSSSSAFTLIFILTSPSVVVMAFEPQSLIQEKLRKNVGSHWNIQVINAAVGPTTDIAKFYVTEKWKAASSLLPFDKKAADKVDYLSF